uniref:Uncharacterized protein n=1 Tax=Setaria italica TaxID=4555 RepID=K4AKI5_SETIT
MRPPSTIYRVEVPWESGDPPSISRESSPLTILLVPSSRIQGFEAVTPSQTVITAFRKSPRAATWKLSMRGARASLAKPYGFGRTLGTASRAAFHLGRCLNWYLRAVNNHLLTGYVHSQETWFRVIRFFGLQWLTPQLGIPFAKWWVHAKKKVDKVQRKGFDSLVWFVTWSLWKEQNHRVHERVVLQPMALAPVVLEEVRL